MRPSDLGRSLGSGQGPRGPAHPMFPTMFLASGFIAIAVVGAVRESPWPARIPMLMVCPAIFTAVQLSTPRLRLSRQAPLSPANWAWVLFANLLVLQPALVTLYGPAKAQLPFLPPDGATNKALVLSCIAYLAYCTAFAYRSRAGTKGSQRASADRPPVRAIAVLFVLAGLFGVVLRFRSFPEVARYFTGKAGAELAANAGQPATVAAAASTFLRPFAAYGFLLLWARAVMQQSTAARTLRLTAYGFAALLCLATYNYNRAAVVIPAVAIAAAYSKHIRRLGFGVLAVLGLLVVAAAFILGDARRIELGTRGGQISRQQAGIGGAISAQEQLQVYGAAPQFSAFVVNAVDTTKTRKLGSTLVASVLQSVPVFGRPFRGSSGTAIYNAMIYGRSGGGDQILPLTAELYLNFGVVGVVAGFLALGAGLAGLQRRFTTCTTPLSSFAYQYLAMWLAFMTVVSLLVFAQIAIYFLMPGVAVALVVDPPWRRIRPNASRTQSHRPLMHIGTV